MQQSTAINGSINTDNKNFPSLSSPNHNAKHDRYTTLCQQTSSQVNLCPFNYFKERHTLCPHNLPAPTVFDINTILLFKFQNKTMELTKEDIHLLYKEHITHCFSSLAEYNFFHAILTHAANSTKFAIVSLLHFSDSVDSIHVALMLYCQEELIKNRTNARYRLPCHSLQDLETHTFPDQLQLKLLEHMTHEDIFLKSLLVVHPVLDLPQHNHIFSKGLIHNAHQLEITLSSPKQVKSSSIYTTQCRTANCKMYLDNSFCATPSHLFCQCEEHQYDSYDMWEHSTTKFSKFCQGTSSSATQSSLYRPC